MNIDGVDIPAEFSQEAEGSVSKVDRLLAALTDSTRLLQLVIGTLNVTDGQRLTIEKRISANKRLGARPQR